LGWRPDQPARGLVIFGVALSACLMALKVRGGLLLAIWPQLPWHSPGSRSSTPACRFAPQPFPTLLKLDIAGSF